MTNIDIKSAFLRPGKATRDVYVIPPRDCSERTFYLLLKVAKYGLVNANAKCQHHYVTIFLKLSLTATLFISQVSHLKIDERLALNAAKVVDDIFMGGLEDTRKQFIERLLQVYRIDTVVHLPGLFKFFGLSIEQDEDYSVHIYAEEKMMGIKSYTLPQMRRKAQSHHHLLLNYFHGNLQNVFICFPGMKVSPFAAFASNFLQQRSSPSPCIILQKNRYFQGCKLLRNKIWLSKAVPRYS